MADWSLPQLDTEYTQWRQALDGRLVDAALMFDSASTSATNIPTGAKRWNSTSSKFEKYNGSAWSDLSSMYAINISGNAATATTASKANGLSAGVALANLANKSITYAKIQNVSTTQRILGRNSAGSGVMEEVSMSQMLDWYNITRGAILTRKVSAWDGLSPGAAGTVLMSGGAGADLYWGTISLSDYALLASPTFTGTPAAPTASAGTATTQIATTAFVSSAVASKVGVDNGYNAVGSIMLVHKPGGAAQTAGATLSGASLYATNISGAYGGGVIINLGQVLSGTYRVLTRIEAHAYDYTVFLAQRIA